MSTDYIGPPDPENNRETALHMQDTANQTHGGRCVGCNNRFFWIPGDRAWAEGQVYSDAGRNEVRITQLCEYCFDTATLDPEDNPELHRHYEELKRGG